VEFAQISRTGSLSDKVAELIKASIINGDYQDGDALPKENDMASQFGVSRIVIREALKDLKTRGLIEIRRGPKGGPYVCQPGSLSLGEHFEDMIRLRRMTIDQFYEVRLLVEPEVLRLVVKNISDAQIRELKKIVQMADTMEDNLRIKENNLNFHRRLGELSGNPFYAMLLNSFMDFMDGFITIIKPSNFNLHEDDQSHQEIVDAIAEGDEMKACTLTRAHLLKTRDQMKTLEVKYLQRQTG
jgi:GntR family transcriptional repressor for pyruvate dehydrogenase complex